MSIKLQGKVKKETLRYYGYASEGDFVRDAVRRRLLELKKADFLKEVKIVRQAMQKKKLTEGNLLADFEKSSRR